MKIRIKPIVSACLLALSSVAVSCGGNSGKYDIVIIGGGTSGTAAAIQAARSDASVLIVEVHEWLGGMHLLHGGGTSPIRIMPIWHVFPDGHETYRTGRISP